MVKEDFLHYVWQYQAFGKYDLCTEEGLALDILKVGNRNFHSGPDFENAQLIIGNLKWVGKVEIHIRSSDWLKHKHSQDPAYENVILHVVWEHDQAISRTDGSVIPTLALKNRVAEEVISKYENLCNNNQNIPCQTFIRQVPEVIKFSMIEKALAKRLERKAQEILKNYNSLNKNFEELAYQTLCKNMGFKLNAEAFTRLAESLPQKIIAKHKGNSMQIEALLFGQAGFLKEAVDDYQNTLQHEYHFLQQKYGLSPMEASEWRFLRTRPQNFPTLRLAQLAQVLNNNQGFFSLFIGNTDLETYQKVLGQDVSAYWETHYYFGKATEKTYRLGFKSIENILINTVAPLLAAYYSLTDDYTHFEKALQLLENLKPENNYITRIWFDLGLKCKSAFDSQGLVEQYNTFCTQKQCLQCTTGIEILKKV